MRIVAAVVALYAAVASAADCKFVAEVYFDSNQLRIDGLKFMPEPKDITRPEQMDALEKFIKEAVGSRAAVEAQCKKAKKAVNDECRDGGLLRRAYASKTECLKKRGEHKTIAAIYDLCQEKATDETLRETCKLGGAWIANEVIAGNDPLAEAKANRR